MITLELRALKKEGLLRRQATEDVPPKAIYLLENRWESSWPKNCGA